jgi:hypothetical protein
MGFSGVAEVRRWLELLAEDEYSAATRHRASQWATPILVEAGTPLVTHPPGLARALFLLGAADLMGDFDHFVYGPEDFAKARDDLEG